MEKIKILSDKEAVELWLKGKNAWNEWVLANPKYSIDFGNVDFSGHNLVSFEQFHFPDGDVNFRGAQFGEGNVDFMGAQFGEGNVDFSYAQFGEGNVDFQHVSTAGNMLFIDTQFGEGLYSFEYAVFGGNVMFTKMGNAQKIKQFSLRYATFKKALAIDAPKGFNCVVDLVSTNLSCHLDMHNFTCTFQENERYPMRVAKDKKDIGRLQRLKELAQKNLSHEQAIDYKIEEMQARRIHEHDNLFKLMVEYLFWAFSNYGRSIILPLSWLFGSTLVAVLYTVEWNLKKANLWQVGECLFARGLPITGNSRILLNSSECDLMAWSAPIPTVYSFLCLLWVFLIGLELRNRFRL